MITIASSRKCLRTTNTLQVFTIELFESHWTEFLDPLSRIRKPLNDKKKRAANLLENPLSWANNWLVFWKASAKIDRIQMSYHLGYHKIITSRSIVEGQAISFVSPSRSLPNPMSSMWSWLCWAHHSTVTHSVNRTWENACPGSDPFAEVWNFS